MPTIQTNENPGLTSTLAVVLTFIIPIRHPQNSHDWQALKRRLSETIKSIANQDDSRWRAIIVANEGSDLPELPDNFEVKHVNFQHNPMIEQGGNELEAFRDAFRLDKGRRVLAGLLTAGSEGYVMIVDDDDFVSCRLTSFVADHVGENGWYVFNGYIWGDGGRLVYEYSDFSKFCGTSLIVQSGLYQVPQSEDATDPEYIRKMLGSHIFIREYLAERNEPLKPLPFIGAVYRIGHAGAHSKSAGMIRYVFFKRELLKNPLKLVGRIRKMRILGAAIRAEFWGPS